MACPISPEHLKMFQMFITACSEQPQLLHIPQLEFFKKFIESFGGRIPLPKNQNFGSTESTPGPKTAKADEAKTPVVEEESDPESEVELDMTGVIEADPEEPHEMGDSTKESTEEEMDEASEYRGKAAAAYSEQNYDKSIELYTEAIKIYPTNALFFAKRGQAYLKQQKPNACIRDCDRALELNCDSAAGYKFRGRANRLLGKWEEAAKDLRQACKLDFDEETDEWLKEVTPNAKKIEQHKMKKERNQKEKDIKAKQERVREAQEANRKAAEDNNKASSDGPNFADFMSAGAGGAGGGGADPMADFKDPEVMAALMDLMENPMNIEKYQNNPKVMKLITKVMDMGGESGGGIPGMNNSSFFRGFPGAGAAGPGATPNPPPDATPKPKTTFQDEDLD